MTARRIVDVIELLNNADSHAGNIVNVRGHFVRCRDHCFLVSEADRGMRALSSPAILLKHGGLSAAPEIGHFTPFGGWIGWYGDAVVVGTLARSPLPECDWMIEHLQSLHFAGWRNRDVGVGSLIEVDLLRSCSVSEDEIQEIRRSDSFTEEEKANLIQSLILRKEAW